MKKHPIDSISIPPHIRDVRVCLLRKYKYIRKAELEIKYDNLPPILLARLFQHLRKAKDLKIFHLKWNCFSMMYKNPEALKLIFKTHSKSIENFDVCPDQVFPYFHRNLFLSLTNAKTATLHTEKELKKASSLRNCQKLSLKFNYEDYLEKRLHNTLKNLKELRLVSITLKPESIRKILLLFNKLDFIEKIEMTIEGNITELDLPDLDQNTEKRIAKLSFGSMMAESFLNPTLPKKFLEFTSLQSLNLELENTTSQLASYLSYFRDFSSLLSLNLLFQSTLGKKSAMAEIIKRLKVPNSLLTLSLTMPLYLKPLIQKNKQALSLAKRAIGSSNFDWRQANVFEEESSLSSFFGSLEKATQLKQLILGFNLLEEFNPHYMNFFVSILSRTPNLQAFEATVEDKTSFKDKKEGLGFFDLKPFLEACSKLTKLEQVEISMPNLLFKDAIFTPLNQKFRSLTLGVNEINEEDEVEFSNLSDFVKKLLKNLSKGAPNLMNFTLDFTEVISEAKIKQRFSLLKSFKNLQGLGLIFRLKKCSIETVKEIGVSLNSMEKLNTMILKFAKSDKNIRGIQKYIKNHRSLRDLLVQINKSSWIDNDYFNPPPNSEENQDGDDDNADEPNGNI